MAVGEWQVYLDGLEFYGYHGVSDEEQKIGHRYRMRIACDFSGPANPVSDDIKQTLDYSEVAKLAVHICTSQQFRTIEAMNWALAEKLFAEFPQVQGITLTTEKALPPIPHVAEAAGVELSILREEMRASTRSNPRS